MVQWAMLQFLRSLIQSSEPAQRAWKKGEPHASSPHEANKEWAPHVVHWQKFIRAAHFREVFSPLPRRGQMGWLESAPFWQTYWTSFQRHCDNAAFAQEDELRQRMVHQVVVCASISGNMHFFDAAEKAGRMALATVLQCLCNYNQPLYHGAVLDWLSIQEPKARRTVFARQQYLWSRLPWEKTMQECMFGVPGRHCDIDAFLDLVADGFTRWPLTPAEKTKALAHIFLSSPGGWHNRNAPQGDLIERLQQRLGPTLLAGVDVPAIVLACGLGPNKPAALKGIKKMSEQLNKNPGQVPVPSGIAQLNVLESLYTVTNPQELHDAIVACRLHRTDEPAAPESYALPDLDPH